jgi:hypothetical protein
MPMDADAVAAAARLPRPQLEDRDFDPGDSLAVNETFWLLKYRKPHGGKADPKEAERFTDFHDELRAAYDEFFRRADLLAPMAVPVANRRGPEEGQIGASALTSPMAPGSSVPYSDGSSSGIDTATVPGRPSATWPAASHPRKL